MSKNDESVNVFDPTGMFRSMRDASMDHWAKMMSQVVNSEAYSQAQGEMLDAWLRSSAPFQKAMQDAMKDSLARLELPSRDDVARLAERFTNVEMRLDDIEAKLDELLKRQGHPQG